MEGVSWIAIGGSAVAAMMLGGLWYSPLMFEKKWRQAIGGEEAAPANPVLIYGFAFIWMIAGAFVFAMFIGPDPELGFALGAGFSAGLFWAAGSLSISYLFEARPVSLHLINGGYHTVQYTLYGLIFGLF